MPAGGQLSGAKLFVGDVTPHTLKDDYWATMENDARMGQDVCDSVRGFSMSSAIQSRLQCANNTVGSEHHCRAALYACGCWWAPCPARCESCGRQWLEVRCMAP